MAQQGFSDAEINEAQALVDRKLSGKRIINPGGRIGQAYSLLLNNPENLRKLRGVVGTSFETINPANSVVKNFAGGFSPTDAQGNVLPQSVQPNQSFVNQPKIVRVQRDTGRSSTNNQAPRNTLQAVQDRGGLGGVDQRLTEIINKQKASLVRNSNPGSYSAAAKNQLRNIEIAALSGGRTIVRGVSDTISLVKAAPKAPGFVMNVLRNPKDYGVKVATGAKAAPAWIKNEGTKTGYLIRTSPGEAVGVIGGELLLFKGTGKAMKYAGKIVEQGSARLSPKFVGAVKTGERLSVESVGGGRIRLDIVGSLPRESLRRQVGRAGTRVTAVSSQADALLSLIKRGKIVRKPLANEDRLSRTGKRLLAKFDNGRINKRELVKLDRLVKKVGTKGILERSFFADPSRRIRPSRLGITKDDDASLMDLLSGDEITFKKNKPQILLFDNVKVQKLPKSLQSVKNKLRKGQALNRNEAAKLLAWQQKLTGKFKPVGFVTREAEITLAPGELIKRKKKIGVALIDGRKVQIVEAQVIKGTRGTRKLLSKARKGSISKREFSKLKRNLKRETGFDIPESSVVRSGKRISLRRLGANLSSRALSKPRVRPGRLSYGSGSRTSRGASGRSGGSSRRSGRSSGSSGRSGRSGASGFSSGRSERSGRSGRSGGSGGSSGRIGRFGGGSYRRGKQRFGSRRSEAKVGYNVYGRSGKKLIKLNKKPLSKIDAESRGAYAIDNTTSKTFIISPAGRVKKYGQIKRWERGYINKRGYKFRSYRIRSGRAVAFRKERSIEKRRFGIDTGGERRQLSLSRYASKLRGGRNASSSSRAKPRYRYVSSGGLFGQRRRIAIKSSGSRTQVRSQSRPRYRIVGGGMFGPKRRILINSRRPRSVTRNNSRPSSRPKYRYVSDGSMFGGRRRIRVKSGRRSPSRSRQRSRAPRSKSRYRYVSNGLFGTRRIRVRPRAHRPRPHKRIKRRRSSPIKRRRSSGGLLGSGGFMS